VRSLLSRLTRKGQVTVPADIRKLLGLREGDRVSFIVEGDVIRFERTGSVVAATAGAVKAGPPLSAEELRDVAERAIAEDVVERSED
jgi:antitoxin PrlF